MPGTPFDASVPEPAAEPAPTPPGGSTREDARSSRPLLLTGVPAAVAALLCAATAGYLWAGGLPRSAAGLIAVLVVAAVVLAVTAGESVRTTRRTADRHSSVATTDAALAGVRAELAVATDHLAGTQAQLAEAHAEVDRLGELLRQADERPAPVRTPAGRQVEVFVNLSRRLQSLVHREIKLLDALENEVEDPDLLKGLFQVDHLATRIRRHAENLAVLGGAVSRRQWSRPVALTEVLRSSIAEVEHYSRVKLVPPIEGTVPGHAVASIIHLVAELIENATMFASPQTQVLLRAQQVTAGVAIEVEDRGLGMQRADQERVNRLLANPEDIDLDELLQDGRIGLFVVSMIARQHGVTVRLQTNIYGGTQAIVILPHSLLGSTSGDGTGELAGGRQALTQHTVELAKRELATALSSAPSSWPAFTPQSAPATPMIAGAPATPMSAGARTGSNALTPAAAERAPQQPAADIRPPLPRRHSQTHLAPQLQLGPRAAAPEAAGGHDPALMASFMRGFSLSDAEADADAGPARTKDPDGDG